MKVMKQSDTPWLSDQMCVKAVKANYNVLMFILSNNYQNIYEPEALGLHKILSDSIKVCNSLPHKTRLIQPNQLNLLSELYGDVRESGCSVLVTLGQAYVSPFPKC